MAATLTTKEVFNAFLGEYEEFKTFFHGHSFTGNPLGAAASIASIDLLESAKTKKQRSQLAKYMKEFSAPLWKLDSVGDIRQSEGVLAVELVADWKTRKPFELSKQVGIRVCNNMANRGVLTRPIGNVIVVMPPYCTTQSQVKKIFTVLHDSIKEST